MTWSLELPNFVQGVIHPKSFHLSDFNFNVARALTQKMDEAVELGQGLFPIYIESPGGDVSSLNAIFSALISAKKRGLKIATVTAGEASSAGAFIFCLGDEGLRFVGEFAKIMIHGFQGIDIPDAPISRHNDLFNIMMKQEEEMFQMISVHLRGNKNKDWLKKELGKRKDGDWYIGAKEALELGIASHIGLPTFSLKVTSEISVNL